LREGKEEEEKNGVLLFSGGSN